MNIGAIVRNIHAFGWDGIITCSQSCDLFNLKTIRASAGYVFHIPYVRMDVDQLNQYRDTHQIISTGLNGDQPNALNLSNKSLILLFNNEGQGNTLPLDFKTVTIPMNPACDSLNVSVASGILMYAINDLNKH